MELDCDQANEALAKWEKAVKENPAKLDELTQRYMNELEVKISQHDQEIEQMCSAHYKSFINCIQELLQVRPNAEGLKMETMDINSELMKSTEVIQKRAEELIKARRVLVNSASSIKLLEKCLFVLKQYSKFNEQLQEKEYIRSLKTLESLEQTHLPTVSRYRFAQSMCKEIPKFRLIIKDATTKDLNEFLEGLLMKSQTIGEIALQSAASRMGADNSACEGIRQCPDVSKALDSIDNFFSPVYTGLLIFTNLGFRDEFEEYFKEQRRKQSRLVFSPPAGMRSIEAYNDYLSSVTGLFVIEDHLMSKTKDFIRPEYLNELWQSAVQSMTSSMKQSAEMCQDAPLMLAIKNSMTLFTFTIRNYGHNTDALDEIFKTIRDRYREILIMQWEQKFDQVSRGDSYHPLLLYQFVPKICDEAIEQYLLFSDADSLEEFEKLIRGKAESRILKKLNEQIDEWLSLAAYDWTIAESTGRASDFITDLVNYLKSAFEAFTNLPQSLAQEACISACRHIAQSLHNLILSEDVKSISLGGMEQFSLDLMQCEVFASSEPVKGLESGKLPEIFAGLRQLCDLFLNEDYSTFMRDLGKKHSKYALVTTATALAIVNKLRDRKKSVFALKKNDKQELRDLFAKNLRQAQQQ